MEYGVPSSSSAARPDYAGSPSAESNNDPAPGGQEDLVAAPKREKEDMSPYESKVGYRSRKGDRFS